MKKIFITNLKIRNVRHLKNIEIPLSDKAPKHLIFTGKNGSGKTSVLDAVSHYLDVELSGEEMKEQRDFLNTARSVSVQFNTTIEEIRNSFQQGKFILAYYKAERIFQAEIPQHVEKVDLRDSYSINEMPRQLFIKYLLDLKVTEALARNSGKIEKAEKIREWFLKLQELLRRIFDDESLELKFDEDTFSFVIYEKNREPFDFNTLSSGFAAVLDIVLDIIIRMEKNVGKSFCFDMPGIVLIDEIETHLHLELQKKVLDLITTIFPNVQFIISTHSPFILNSLENVAIYDLENHTLVENGLANVPYEGIVEGYFKAETLSMLLKDKFERYKILVKKQSLSDDDFEEIAELEMFLDEIPDYLALKITTEYQRLKAEFEKREDV